MAARSLDYRPALTELTLVHDEVAHDKELHGKEPQYLFFNLCSVLINQADDERDLSGLALGIEWATSQFSTPGLVDALLPQLLYNIANAEAAVYQINEQVATAGTDAIGRANADYRMTNPEPLKQVRANFNVVGHLEDLDELASVRSTALCNLANTMDDSGRWVEAYASYDDAFTADPLNGNAAGNLADLLLRRIRFHTGQSGHLAAVFNKWAETAKSLRGHTVKIAGEAAAVRWDELELFDNVGHLAHIGDPLDPYQAWIVQHRLALVAAVEGLGTDNARWDTESISGTVPGEGHDVPKIYAAMNVLKAEYVVARELAFRGQQMIDESGFGQHPADPGSYIDTLDTAVYGQGPALLLLAQRSALDLLDKIAVTANEHFAAGINPNNVDFTNFWKDKKTGGARPKVNSNKSKLARLALYELSLDLGSDGIYPRARALRNAGTHRLVHATISVATGPTKDTFSTVNLDELEATALEALWVARAAYLYLVDLIEGDLPTAEATAMSLRNQI
jgi:hypothetical protein